MPRVVPHDRFRNLVEVAARTFIAFGYRRTQIADIAEALGLAKGTLYGYVESKEALFDAAVRFADGHALAPTPADLPLSTPAPGSTVAYIRQRIAAESADLVLVQVVSGARPSIDPAEELTAIMSDLYHRIARNRLALKLIDRCATDYPELAQAWFGEGRWAQHQLLVALLRSRMKEQRIRPLQDVEVVARTVLETIAFWAMHRHFDASPQAVDDDAAERTVIDLLVAGILKP